MENTFFFRQVLNSIFLISYKSNHFRLKPVLVIQITLARNMLFVNERLIAGQIQQLNSDYDFVIKIYDILNTVLENNTNQSQTMESDLVASFKRCDNKIRDWILLAMMLLAMKKYHGIRGHEYDEFQIAKMVNEKDGDLKFQIDKNGDTALTLCARYGDEKTMRYLLEDFEFDIKQTSIMGRNAFHDAIMNEDHGFQIAKMINEKDGDLKFQKDKNGDTALTLCAKYDDEKTMAYLRDDLNLPWLFLLKNIELDVKQTDGKGRNLFHQAIVSQKINKHKTIQMLKLLEEKDGDLKFQKDKNGDTALTLCAEYGDEKTIEIHFTPQQ